MRIDNGVVNSQLMSEKPAVQEARPAGQRRVDIAKEGYNKENNTSFPGERKLIEAIEKSNPEFMSSNTNLNFSINERTKQIVVKIVDKETNEVIKEVPSEKILEMIADMMERAGVFVDKRG